MMKCVAYLRYSSAKQNSKSFDHQTEEIVKYCQKKGLLLIKIFYEKACTGKKDNRPAFLEMIAEAKAHPEWQVVLVFDLSRFARNEEDSNHYKTLIRDLGIAVISVTEPCTEEDPGGFMEAALDKLNAYDSLKKGVVSYDSLKIKSRECKHCGGKPPLGYDVDKETGLLVINESESELVKTIFNMYSVGYSYSKMAEYLNNIGAKTKAGNMFTLNSFHDILTQEKYVGTFSWGKHPRNGYNSSDTQTVVENGCPAIISRKLFDEAQERISNSSCGNRTSKSQKHYMLNGLRILKCGVCGKYLVGKSYSSRGYKYVKYACPCRSCKNKAINVDELDNCVADILVEKFFLSQDREVLNALISSFQDQRLLKIYENKLRGLKMKENNLIELITEVPSEAAMNKLAVLNKEKAVIEEKIAEQQVSLPSIPSKSNEKGTAKFCKAIREELISSDALDVKLFIKSTISEIVVDSTEVSIKLT